MAHLNPCRWAFCITISLTGCGDALVDGDFRGVPLWQISGMVGQSEGAVPDTTGLRIALFWAPGGPRDNDLEHYVEDPSSSLPAQLPQALLLNVFQPPTPSMRVQAGSPGYAVGRILGYLDRNQNGLRDPTEPIAGLNVPTAVLYAPQPVPAAQSPTGGTLAAGFQQVLLAQRCDRPPPAPLSRDSAASPWGPRATATRTATAAPA